MLQIRLLLTPVIVILALYGYYTAEPDRIQTKILSIYHRNPFSQESKTQTYDFVPTSLESACLQGHLDPDNGSPQKPPIPNVVHYVVALRDPDLLFTSYLSMRAALVSLQPTALKIHHTHLNPDNPYVQRLLRDDRVQLVAHDPDKLARKMSKSTKYAHLSDVLRLQILQEEGGIYLDSDAFVLQSFSTLLNSSRDVVLGHEGGDRWGLCNAIILARPGAAFIDRWIDSYAGFNEGEWNLHSVTLPRQMAEDHPGEVCPLPPHAFFWPTWTWEHVRWMHQPLDGSESDDVKTKIKENNGSLFEGQLAYHAWNQVAFHQHMKHLDDEVVMGLDTRFNLLVRPFVSNDTTSTKPAD